MSDFIMGIYWYERQQTLRQYSATSHAFIDRLKVIHPVFQSLEWVGNRPGNAAKLASDLSNLDALIYTYAQDKNAIYQNPNIDGTASWDSFGLAGFDMHYSTEKAVPGGRVSVWIGAGRTGVPRFANGVTIKFPSRENDDFPHREFYDHDFLRKFMLQLIAFWQPEEGILTSRAFDKAIATQGAYIVGWLTYARDPRAAALRNSPDLKNLIFETTPDGGTLISLGPTPISSNNTEQVKQARRLRQILIDEHLVKS